jgi:hypothetical protein
LNAEKGRFVRRNLTVSSAFSRLPEFRACCNSDRGNGGSDAIKDVGLPLNLKLAEAI